MKPRRFGEEFYLTLKAKWRQLVREAGGTAYAAELTGTYESRISEWGAPQHMDRFPGIDKIADIEMDSGLTIVTRALADLHGYDLVQREAGKEIGILHHLSRIVREAGEAQTAMADMMADGKVTDAERAATVKELDDAIAAMQAARAELLNKGLKIVGGK